MSSTMSLKSDGGDADGVRERQVTVRFFTIVDGAVGRLIADRTIDILANGVLPQDPVSRMPDIPVAQHLPQSRSVSKLVLLIGFLLTFAIDPRCNSDEPGVMAAIRVYFPMWLCFIVGAIAMYYAMQMSKREI